MIHSLSDRSDEALLRQAEALKMNGEYAQAIVLLERLLLRDPDNAVIYEELADNELSLEHFSRAEKAAKQALTFDAESYTGHYILGFIHSHFQRWEKSIASLKLANRFYPNNPEILRCLGWSLFSGHHYSEGMVTLERALNLDPRNTLTLCDLGVACIQRQDFAKARALFAHAIDLEPNNPRTLDCLQMVERLEKQMRQ